MPIDWEGAVEKLVRITANSELEWTAVEIDISENLSERQDGQLRNPAYTARVKDRVVLVYEYRYKSFTDEFEWHWENEVGIEFVDDGLRLEYQWPQVPGRRQLLDAIRLKVAKADAFIEEFLAD